MRSNKLIALLLALAPTALASTTWYVDGVNGNDSNNCNSPQTACKTIGHAISLASSGDSINVASATYTENLNIGFSLTITGANARKTIIDGGQNGTVVYVSNSSGLVTISPVTIRNGSSSGIGNAGTLTINNSTISRNQISINCKLDCASAGGGVFNGGTMIISDSTPSGNSVISQRQHTCFAEGGGIRNSGTLTINNMHHQRE
jgi:hypothetical protein